MPVFASCAVSMVLYTSSTAMVLYTPSTAMVLCFLHHQWCCIFFISNCVAFSTSSGAVCPSTVNNTTPSLLRSLLGAVSPCHAPLAKSILLSFFPSTKPFHLNYMFLWAEFPEMSQATVFSPGVYLHGKQIPLTLSGGVTSTSVQFQSQVI